ncbi:MAG: DUF2269 family protein [Euryarchaeota archaeon]|nr:DUF2269 family protein [Euryarchaeota archaeon]
MIMAPKLRKLMLIVHLVVSIGWIGAVAAYLVLDLTATTNDDPATLRAAYMSMGLITWRAIVPLAVATLATGLVMSLGTKWGLIRHYWAIISLVLTVLAIAVLLSETRTIDRYAALAEDPSTPDGALRALGGTLPHSVGGLFVLLVVTVLNVYKPRGVTPYGWRKQQGERRLGEETR